MKLTKNDDLFNIIAKEKLSLKWSKHMLLKESSNSFRTSNSFNILTSIVYTCKS